MRGEGIVPVMDVNGNNGNGGNCGFGDGNGWWIVLILLFALNGWNGKNGNNGGGDSTSSMLPYLLARDSSSNSVQPNYVLTSDFAQVDRKLDSIANGICDSTFALNNTITNGFAGTQQTLCQGFGGINQAITSNGYETRIGINGINTQLASCCCDVREAIQGVNFNQAQNTCAINNTITMNTRDIIENQNANYRALHDEIIANRIEDKNAQIQAQQNEINALRLAASQEKQTNYLYTSITDKLSPCPVPAYLTCNPNAPYNYSVVANNGCGCSNY